MLFVLLTNIDPSQFKFFYIILCFLLLWVTTLCRLFWIHFYRVLPTSHPALVIVEASRECSTITMGFNGAECDALFAWYRHMVQNPPCWMAKKWNSLQNRQSDFYQPSVTFLCSGCPTAYLGIQEGRFYTMWQLHAKGPLGNRGDFWHPSFSENFLHFLCLIFVKRQKLAGTV